MDAVGKLGQEVGALPARGVRPGTHVGRGMEVELASELAVDRMLDDDVDDANAEIDDGQELSLGFRRPVSDGDDGAVRQAAGVGGDQIAPDGGDDRLAGRSEDGHVVDDRLAADPECLGEDIASDRPSRGGQGRAEARSAVRSGVRGCGPIVAAVLDVRGSIDSEHTER